MEYDGSGVSFEAFLESFNAGARMAGWDDAYKLYRLGAGLRGEALEYYSHQMSEAEKQTFETAVEALGHRFKEKKALSTYRAQLKNRRLHPKESTTQFVADLKKLVVRAYPGVTGEGRASLVLSHFLEGLPDTNAARTIAVQNPQTTEEALSLYETYTSYNSPSEVPRPPRARAVQSEPQTHTPVGETVSKNDMERMWGAIKEIQTKLTQPGPNGTGENSQNRRPPQRDSQWRPQRNDRGGHRGGHRREYGTSHRRNPDSVQCYGCLDWGHYVVDCPANKTESHRPFEATSLKQQGN
jgi:hypothetical protein